MPKAVDVASSEFTLRVMHAPQENDQSLIDMVFIHGLGGDLRRTWTHESATEPWIQDRRFLGPLAEQIRVMSFGYNANRFSNVAETRIIDHAAELVRNLVLKRLDCQERPIIFVAHSLGGLVVKRAILLCHTRDDWACIKQSTKSVIFLGTPHMGSEHASALQVVQNIAAWAKLESSIATNLTRELGAFSPAIQDINSEFTLDIHKSMDLLCCFETQPQRLPHGKSAIIVPQWSAILQGVAKVPMQCTHSELPRFDSPTSPRFENFWDEVQRLVRRAQARAASGRNGQSIPDNPPRYLAVEPEETAQVQRPSGPDKPQLTSTHMTESVPEYRSTEKPESSILPSMPKVERWGEDKIGPLPISGRGDRDSTYTQSRSSKKPSQIPIDPGYKRIFLSRLRNPSSENLGQETKSLHPETCNWIASNTSFIEWAESKKGGLLFITGEPGCGKTHLARYIENYLMDHVATPESIVMSFYCDRLDSSRDNPPILDHFTRRALEKREQLFRHIHERYGSTLKDSFTPSFNSLMNLFPLLVAGSNAGRSFIIIDGLDQCSDGYISQLLHGLDHTLKRGSSNVMTPSVLITSRTTDMIRSFAHCHQHIAITRQIVTGDIRSVVHDHWNRFLQVKHLNSDVDPVSVAAVIVERAHGSFLFASSILDELWNLKDLSASSIFTLLTSCPPTMESRYSQDMKMLRASREDLWFTVLFLSVQLSSRALSIKQVKQALKNRWGHFTPEYDLASDIVRHCPRLVRIVGDDTLVLSHQTLVDFLRKSHNQEGIHFAIATLCLDCLEAANWEEFYDRRSPNSYFADPAMFPTYAATFWPLHVKLSKHRGRELTRRIREFWDSDAFLFSYPITLSAKTGYRSTPDPKLDRRDITFLGVVVRFDLDCFELIRASHAAPKGSRVWHAWEVWRHLAVTAALGKGPILSWLRTNGWGTSRTNEPPQLQGGRVDFDPDSVIFVTEQEIARFPAAFRFAAQGDGLILKSLLGNFSPCDPSGDVLETPLQVAAFSQSAVCARMLLGSGMDVNGTTSYNGFTPLHIACERGNQDLVQMFLDAGADANRPTDDHGYTPLEMAVLAGRTSYVRLLLENGADPRRLTSTGQPLAFLVVYSGANDIMELLLSRIDVDLFFNGERLIRLALLLGNADCVSLLLRAKADVDHPAGYKDGDTLAYLAAKFGYTTLLGDLIDAGAPVDAVRGMSYLPLHAACFKGHRGCAELLLRHGSNPSRLDAAGNTPLALAVQGGHVDIVIDLLSYGADVQLASHGYPAIQMAAYSGHIGLVRALLDASPRSQLNLHSSHGTTALGFAVAKGNLDMAKWPHSDRVGAVLAGGVLEPKFPYGRVGSVVHEAAIRGNALLLGEFLKSTDRPDFWAGYEWGPLGTPLTVAAGHGHIDAVRLLLQYGADPEYCRPDRPAGDGQGYHSVFHAASMGGNLTIFTTILSRLSDQDIDRVDDRRATPLLLACFAGASTIVEYLLQKGANPDAKDVDGFSVVHGAAQSGSVEVLDLLLSHQPSLAINAATHWGYTPLYLVAFYNSRGSAMVAKLLQLGADPNAQETQGPMYTILSRAVFRGNVGLVRTLLDQPDIDPHVKDSYGRNSLQVAVAYQDCDMRRVLVMAEELSDSRLITNCDVFGYTAFDYVSLREPSRRLRPLQIRALLSVARELMRQVRDKDLQWPTLAKGLLHLGDAKRAEQALRRGSIVQEWPTRKLISALQCDSCHTQIYGTVHVCLICPDFDLCSACYERYEERRIRPGVCRDHKFGVLGLPNITDCNNPGTALTTEQEMLEFLEGIIETYGKESIEELEAEEDQPCLPAVLYRIFKPPVIRLGRRFAIQLPEGRLKGALDEWTIHVEELREELRRKQENDGGI